MLPIASLDWTDRLSEYLNVPFVNETQRLKLDLNIMSLIGTQRIIKRIATWDKHNPQLFPPHITQVIEHLKKPQVRSVVITAPIVTPLVVVQPVQVEDILEEDAQEQEDKFLEATSIYSSDGDSDDSDFTLHYSRSTTPLPPEHSTAIMDLDTDIFDEQPTQLKSMRMPSLSLPIDIDIDSDDD
jgi:hypothetical protein